MAYVILAKGKGKLFFITETTDTIIFLTLYIVSFNLWGIDGFGYAFFLWYFTYSLIVGFSYFSIFKLRLDFSCYQWITWALVSSIGALICMENDCIIGTIAILIAATSFSALKFTKMIRKKQ
jgi:hypothetical protein